MFETMEDAELKTLKAELNSQLEEIRPRVAAAKEKHEKALEDLQEFRKMMANLQREVNSSEFERLSQEEGALQSRRDQVGWLLTARKSKRNPIGAQ